MPKTTAQRQAEYRARRPFASENGERRLNLWLSTGATLALERLARRYCVTKQEMLERMLRAEDDSVTAGMAPDTTEWDTYFGDVVTQ